MQSYKLSLLCLAMAWCCCQQPVATSAPQLDPNRLIIVDSTLHDSLAQQIRFVSDRRFSQFETPVELRYFSNGLQTDSLLEKDFRMSSWYSIINDTIDLVAHTGSGLETESLLLRFINGKINIYLFRAPHSKQHYFKINPADTFTDKIEVPPIYYRLHLSEIPDSLHKQVIYGHIDMESQDYYDKRDSSGPLRTQMKFYFRSQYIPLPG